MIKVAGEMFPSSERNGYFVSKQFTSIHRGAIISLAGYEDSFECSMELQCLFLVYKQQ